MVQMLVEPGRPERNLARAIDRIAEASRNGANLILLPEALDLGWTHPATSAATHEIPNGEYSQRLAAAARTHQVYLCAGLTERTAACHFNSAVLISPTGELLLKHRKLNELVIGHSCYGQGNRLETVDTPLGTIGVMICADAFAPSQVISRTLGFMGAQIILSPCAWAVPSNHNPDIQPYGQLWIDNYGPVARDFKLWIAGASNVGPVISGPWSGRRCIGSSLLVNPKGEVELQGPYGEQADTILYHNLQLEPRPTRGDGWQELWLKELAIHSTNAPTITTGQLHSP